MFHNLDVIIYVGYRVNRIGVTQFRQWFSIRGYMIDTKLWKLAFSLVKIILNIEVNNHRF